ncbi:MAG: OsmC family peroxiredoxin [bacterium]|nr:OsmC family peroxiredoxin [bacterium]
MGERKANAEWSGTLKEGTGNISLGSGVYSGPFSFDTRFGEASGTNPEELLGAALAGCYSMALNAHLERENTPAKNIKAEAKVYLGKDDEGFLINRIDLETEGEVDGLDQEAFEVAAELIKKTCIISRALAGTNITLKATLVNAKAA